MNNSQKVSEAIVNQGILPLYFNADETVTIEILKSVYKAGIRAIEYTNRGEAALKNFTKMVEIRNAEMPDLLLGVGTIKTLEQVIQKNPTDPDSYFDLAYLYLQSAQPLSAIRVYDQFEKNYGLEESVVLQKEKLYLKLNQFDKAVGEIKKLIDAYPGEVQYMGMLAELYALNGKKEKASEVYQQILAIDPENAQ